MFGCDTSLPPLISTRMRWLKPTLQSFYGLLGQPGPIVEPVDTQRVEQIRQAMIDEMPGDASSLPYLRLMHRLCHTDDVEALWYARAELMSLLCAYRGEEFAQQRMDKVSTLFKGLLPASLSKRQSTRTRTASGRRSGPRLYDLIGR